MKLKVTEIECTADEIKNCNLIADGIVKILRNCFNGTLPDYDENDEEGDTE